ncbi:ABC transporter ATP-binding protein [Paenibacillus sp. sptzw28]|uniref:ABC transporter ATP-binding protein n=1 Tax=Paenibacillus sp. sptzw28 TaxID=715179 RepID=UPI001C6E1410|nr:ABC transporter ATP-binding protein [Paenibacillus sp. sptzw28]QYR24181.1 ABC transporter ATP-binding protein [Paenibacillus sp. sptzw28]
MKLELRNVEKSYGGRKVLHDVSFSVDPHQFICILGHSGCGKSTVLNMIAGYLRPDRGEITVMGKPVDGPSKTRGLVFQEHALFPWFNVLDNVAFGPEVQGSSKKAAREKAMHFLKLVGLADYAASYPHQLSGGMKQRVGIARALAGEPDILLMDEPFGALDILTREMMQMELLRIWLKLKPMVLFVTHSIDEAIHLADRIIVMKDGAIAADVEIADERPRRLLVPHLVEIKEQLEEMLLREHPLVS